MARARTRILKYQECKSVIKTNFNIAEYRKTLGSFMTGVTVVTTIDDLGNPRGFTANSFTSVSLNPPLILVCIAKVAGSCPVFTEADGFAVNILAEDQRHVAIIFASRETDRFSFVEWSIGPGGNPVFTDAASWIDCSLRDQIDAGDHWILIGQTVGFDSRAKPLLGFCQGSYFSASLEHSANRDTERSTEVVAILEQADAILLLTNRYGKLTLPKASHIGAETDSMGLVGRLKALGISAELGFVFSVIDDAQMNGLRIIYRGVAVGRPSEGDGVRFYELADIPWDNLDGPGTQMALERYVTERAQSRFGIYMGSEETGRIAGLVSA